MRGSIPGKLSLLIDQQSASVRAGLNWVQPLYAPADAKEGASNRPARILIVEDDYFVAVELEHRLQEAGFEVVGTAVTADEALEIARAKEPDIAIMDIRLSGSRDGIDAAIDLLQELELPSIFASAHGDRTTRERAEAAKPLGFLEKPYSPAALISAVRSALGKEL